MKKPPQCPPKIESLEQWEQYQKWEDYNMLQATAYVIKAKKGPAIDQPLNYNHPSPFDELDKVLNKKPDSTSSKDSKKNRFEHLEIESDGGSKDSEGDGGSPPEQPEEG